MLERGFLRCFGEQFFWEKFKAERDLPREAFILSSAGQNGQIEESCGSLDMAAMIGDQKQSKWQPVHDELDELASRSGDARDVEGRRQGRENYDEIEQSREKSRT
jgi:hypothetical protein